MRIPQRGINALARASDLKTTPPTDKEPPLADRKRRGKSDACQCVLYMYFHLMMVMVMGTTIHYFAKTFLFLNRFSSMTPQKLRIAKVRALTKPDFLFWVWGAVKIRKTPYF